MNSEDSIREALESAARKIEIRKCSTGEYAATVWANSPAGKIVSYGQSKSVCGSVKNAMRGLYREFVTVCVRDKLGDHYHPWSDEWWNEDEDDGVV